MITVVTEIILASDDPSFTNDHISPTGTEEKTSLINQKLILMTLSAALLKAECHILRPATDRLKVCVNNKNAAFGYLAEAMDFSTKN